jgi:hypothetical protein
MHFGDAAAAGPEEGEDRAVFVERRRSSPSFGFLIVDDHCRLLIDGRFYAHRQRGAVRGFLAGPT